MAESPTGRSGLGRSLPWLVTATASRALFEALLPFILVRLAGVEPYGAWEVCKTVMLVVTPIGTLGLHLAYVDTAAAETDPARRGEQYRALLIVGAAALCVTGLLVLAASPFVGARLLSEDADYRLALQLSALLVPLEGLSIFCLYYWQAHREFRTFALASVALVIVDSIAVVAVLSTSESIARLITVLAVTRTLRVGLMLAFIFRSFPPGRADFSVIRPFLRFGVPLLIANLFLWLIKLADRFVLADVRPLEEVGMYGLLFNIANVVFMVALPFQAFIYPSLAKAHGESDDAAFALTARRCFQVYNMLALPAGLGVCLLLLPLLQLLRVDVSSAASVFGVLLLLLGAKYAYSLVSLLKFVSAVRGRSQRLVALTAVGVVINLALNFALTPRYGMMGAGIAACVSVVALLVGLVADLSRIGLPLRFMLAGGLLPAVAACATMTVVVYPLRTMATSWLGLLVPAAVGGVVYGVVVYALSPDVRERIKASINRVGTEPIP